MPGSERELEMETRSKRRKRVEEEGEEEVDVSGCRLMCMAPETVCMLVAWAKTWPALELRATCRTLKRAVDEVTPWMMRRYAPSSPGMGETAIWCLAATDVGVMRRAMLHTPNHMARRFGRWALHWAAVVGGADMIELCRENGCPWDEGTCIYAKELGSVDLLVLLHAGKRSTWPCKKSPCKMAWVRHWRGVMN